MTITSDSMGNPGRFRTFDELRRALAALPDAPRSSGRIALIVSRQEGGRREMPGRSRLTPEGGVLATPGSIVASPTRRRRSR